jgi:hypothetical protein
MPAPAATAAPAPLSAAATGSPEKLTLRAYNVGFGDCFLLTFHYPAFKRRVLIDFGSTAAPRNADDDYMLAIAKDIQEQCTEANGEARLDAVVATHRHRDHISGFATGGDGSGEIIASLNPRAVIQPWTEDPNAQPDANAATATTYRGGSPDPKGFVASLHDMHAVAGAIATEAESPYIGLGTRSAEQLRFLGDDNIANPSAIRNLMEMGRKGVAAYVNCGSKSGLEEVLPGVTVHVLGPPTLEQTDTIRKERSRDPNEFWQFRSFWRFQAAAGSSSMTGALVFPEAPVYDEGAQPPSTRWFVARTQKVRGDQLMELVRELDNAMNNTSVILLFEVGGMRLLFPGDAQIENWAYALAQPAFQDLLKGVNVYKVGHHGSLNATPKSLWELFEHKQEQETPDRLKTVVSTKPGKHGSTQANTEVPRRTLVAALEQESDYFSTQTLLKAQMYREFEFQF